MMYQKFFVLCLIISLTSSLDLSPTCVASGSPSTFSCASSGPCSCTPPQFIVIADLVAGYLTMVLSLLVVMGFLFVREMRYPPGDIVFAFSIVNIALAANWIYQGHYQVQHLIDPESQMCKAISFIDVITSQLSRFYTFSFFCFFFMATRMSLRITKTFRYFCLIVPFIATLVEYYRFESFDGFGMSIFGTCYSKTTNSIKWQIINLLFHVLFPIITILALKKSLPQCKQLNATRYEFLRYYYLYVIAACIIGSVITFINIFTAVELDSFTTNPDDLLSVFILYLTYAGNLLRVLRPLILTLTRICDPSVRRYWVKLLCCCGKNKKKQSPGQSDGGI